MYTTGPKAEKLARKYAPLVPVLAELIAGPDTPLTCHVKARILRQLGSAQERFAAIAPRRPREKGGDRQLAISISLVVLLAVAVWLLHRYAGLNLWHGLACVLFGFYLATSSLAPEIRTTVTAIVHALTSQG